MFVHSWEKTFLSLIFESCSYTSFSLAQSPAFLQQYQPNVIPRNLYWSWGNFSTWWFLTPLHFCSWIVFIARCPGTAQLWCFLWCLFYVFVIRTGAGTHPCRLELRRADAALTYSTSHQCNHQWHLSLSAIKQAEAIKKSKVLGNLPSFQLLNPSRFVAPNEEKDFSRSLQKRRIQKPLLTASTQSKNNGINTGGNVSLS